MTDLIIDASIVADVCLGTNSEAAELIESRERSHLRNWIYVGQKVEIYELLIDDIRMQDKYQSKNNPCRMEQSSCIFSSLVRPTTHGTRHITLYPEVNGP